jgi:hypothetical protein
VGLERGPLSLVSTTEEILDRKVAASVWKTEITAVGMLLADHEILHYPQKLAQTWPKRGGHSVRIVRSRTKVTELLW